MDGAEYLIGLASIKWGRLIVRCSKCEGTHADRRGCEAFAQNSFALFQSASSQASRLVSRFHDDECSVVTGQPGDLLQRLSLCFQIGLRAVIGGIETMTTLYYAVGACSLASHIVLEWIGAPYEAVRVDYGSKELLAVNPAGAVPTLRENDG